jgi:hypothetical protein
MFATFLSSRVSMENSYNGIKWVNGSDAIGEA